MRTPISIPCVSVRVTGGLAFALLTLFLAGCDGANSQAPNGMPPPEVAVVTIEPKNIPASFEYTGQTAGSREVEVRARVTGILKKRNYTEGGKVAARFAPGTEPGDPALTAAIEAELAK